MSCRSCGNSSLVPVLSLGETPLADGLLYADQLGEREPRVPLDFAFCPACSLAQITQTVDPEILFCNDYPYYTSVSPQLQEHFAASARALIASRGLDERSMVVEAASNDGAMLRVFADAGIPVLGIDPASGPAEAARKRGVPTLCDFFGASLARTLRDERGIAADLVLGNNVLAHVPDLNGFVQGIATLLAPDGAAVIEVPYVVDLVRNCEFDTIYHQHLCYFSATSLDVLFRRHGLFLNDVERTPIHGGSLRLTVERSDRCGTRVSAMLAEERALRIDEAVFYAGFVERVTTIKNHLRELLDELRREGRRVAAYGAAAKATTLCSYVGIDTGLVEYVVDRNPHKHGRYMGGSRLPIVPPSALEQTPPDYLLVLAWNFAGEIMEQERAFRESGGRFIIPIPEVKVVA